MPQIANVSQETQFNIFKRDKFTCSDCRKKVPTVVLYVGYKVPPEDGGTDEVDNLITRCYDCSGGNPLEMLSERRKQLNMLLEWKRTWKNFQEDNRSLIIDYVNAKIGPDRFLNKTGEKNVASALKLSTIDVILDTVDEVFESCIKYDKDDEITKESAEEFINNIGRFLYVKSQPPVEKHLYLIRGSVRKMFTYCNDQTCMKILKDYVKALRAWNWTEEEILNDLKTELMPHINECKNWSQFKDFVEGWTKSIYKQIKEAKSDNEIERKPLKEDYIEEFPYHDVGFAQDIIDVMVYLYKGFPEYTEQKGLEFELEIWSAIRDYVSEMHNNYLKLRKIPPFREGSIHECAESINYDNYFSLEEDSGEGEISFGSRAYIAEGKFTDLFEDALSHFTYNNFTFDYATGVKISAQAIRVMDGIINPLRRKVYPPEILDEPF